MIELEPSRLEAFAARLSASPRRRIGEKELWAAFSAAFPGRPQGVEERRWFLAALEALAERGLIRLPSKKGSRWDGGIGLSVPASVDLASSAPPTNARTWREHPWHPHLSWIGVLPQLRLEHEQFLLKVHQGLVNGWFQEAAPLKYRSLQLTGNEKKLATLLKTPLFADGRLSLELLGSYRELLPLAWASVGDAPKALIFENAGPFSVARTVLSRMKSPPYGVVAYGGGKSILASLPHITTIGRSIEAIEYVGDLDLDGLIIARAAQKIAEEAGLPRVSPARGIHSQMLAAAKNFGRADGWPGGRSASGPAILHEAARFLPEDARSTTVQLLADGRRVPEEVLGPAEMASLWEAK